MSESESQCVVVFVLQDAATLGCARDRIEARGAAGQSLLEIALGAGIGIEHTCGGVCACSTCHVWVKEGMEHLSEAGDEELDRVEQARDVRMYSRLACQARIARGGGSIVCEVPAWNRNVIKESH